jgi:excinuclease ABC subunit C
MKSLKEKLKCLPTKPGVYLFKDKSGTVIYVGKAKSLRKRVSSYFTKKPDIKTGILLERLKDIDFILTKTELEALLLEDELVKKYRPRYNVALRDDKAYPMLKLTVNEEWPRLFLARRKEKDDALYFGRYQGRMVREVIRLVKKLFPIRWCKESPLKMRQQPCLYYRIGSCSGPCVGKISRGQYLSLVEAIKDLLEGKMEKSVSILKTEMEKSSEELNFERAAYLRDRIEILEKMMEGGELKKAPAPRVLSEIVELKKKLNLAKDPMRIEAFDISNISGKNVVGSMVVFLGGVPLKNDYRKFKIRSVKEKPNDVAAIYEVVKRRYTGSLTKELALPDLIMVDGGLAQANAAFKALKAAHRRGLSVIGLAKRNEEIYFPKKNRPLRLKKNSPALKLLQRVRDEAHRFAITFHRAKRAKSLFGA